MTESMITSDNPFTEQHQLLLPQLLNTLVPPSEDGRMPGAAEMDFARYLQEQNPELIEPIKSALDAFKVMIGDDDFSDLPAEQRVELVRGFEASSPALFQLILSQTYVCYYQQDKVLEGLGLEARPPFPQGNVVEQGDLSLLDPVRERGRIYR